jgi:asparagine synthase (glutamine-hydrolysing)
MYVFAGILSDMNINDAEIVLRKSVRSMTSADNIALEITNNAGLAMALQNEGWQSHVRTKQTDLFFYFTDAHLFDQDELKRKLDLASDSDDADIIFEGYSKWGDDCVNFLKGEFVFVVYSKLNGVLTVFTDKLGSKPFYYSKVNDKFIFSNRLFIVEELLGDDQKVFNPICLIDHHFNQGEPDATYNKNIQNLCGAKKLTLQNGKLLQHQYWSLQVNNKYTYKNDEDWYDQLRILVKQSVLRRLSPNGKTGILLSGGLDSSAITCILAEALKEKNQTLYSFSSVLPTSYKGSLKDERCFIKHVLKRHDNIEPYYFDAIDKGPFSFVEKALLIDESIPNIQYYMDHELLQASEDNGISNLYLGWGGDFAVSVQGIGVIKKLVEAFHWCTAYRLAINFSKKYHRSLPSVLRSEYLNHLGIIRLYLDSKKKKHKLSGLNYEVLNQVQFINTATVMDSIMPQTNNGRIGKLVQRLASRGYYYNQKTSLPLVDVELLEFMMEVPVRMLFENGLRRSFFRYAMEGILPPEIQWRMNKTAFVPDAGERVVESKEVLDRMMESMGKDSFFSKYYNRDVIKHQYRQVFSAEGEKSIRPPLRLSQMYLGYAAMEILRRKEYKL